jgi:pimeloyl-ACP methyl ester carboxylesterase
MNDGEISYRERSYLSQDGLRLYFRDYGDLRSTRTPVLCIPGLTRNSKDFHHLANRLGSQRRVLCLDLRGRGRSDYDTDWRHYVPTVYLNDIRHLLALTDIPQVIIVGTSLGGLLAMAIGIAFPTALAGAVINDVGPDIRKQGLDKIMEYIRNFEPVSGWTEGADYLRRHFSPLSLETEAEWLEFAHNSFRKGADGKLHFDWDPAILKPLGGDLPDLWPIYRSLTRLPLVLLRGGVSQVLTSETFARMREEHPGAITVEIPGVGHAPTLREPPVEKAIDELLHQIDG